MRVVVILLALSASGCASGLQALVVADKAVYRTLTVTTASANAYCGPAPEPEVAAAVVCEPSPADKVGRCVCFNRDLVPVLETAKANNLAIQEGSAAEIPATISAMLRLRNIVWELFPEGMREMLAVRFEQLYGQLSALRGGR